MKKALFYFVPFTLLLAGCAAASADAEYSDGDCIEAEVSLSDGYYLSDNDDSYIHISGGQIELCGYDYVTAFTEDWNAVEGDKASLEEYVDNSAEIFLSQCSLQDYTPVKFIGMGENGADLTLLAVNYELAQSTGTYTGYILNDDGTISKVDNVYSYVGEELPAEEL